MLYPFKFDHIYKVMPWAGRDLELFRQDLPPGIVGESWDVACHDEGMSTVVNGEHAGKTLRQLIEVFGTQLLGTEIATADFPLMVRLVNPKDKLSVQVHPTDEYALSHGMRQGKTEAWYIMEAFEGAFIYAGAQGCTIDEFRVAVTDGSVEKYLNKISVHKGELYYIPSGQVHALGPGQLVVEIGQNANRTYRLFDYDRGRRLDIDDAMGVIDISKPPRRSRSVTISTDGYREEILCLSPYFACYSYEIDDSYSGISSGERFEVLTCVDGHGRLEYEQGTEYLQCGDSALIPATLGHYEVFGKLRLLKVNVPDMGREQHRILSLAGVEV